MDYIVISVIFLLIFLYYLIAAYPETTEREILAKYNIKSEEIVEGLDDISGRYCPSCDGLSFGQCTKCFNCAFKATGFKGKCMNGYNQPDEPLKSTERWLTNDTFWRNVYASHDNNCAYAPYSA